MPNPAISRLSASPTPGNATRYSNVAQCVRETCTEAVREVVKQWATKAGVEREKSTTIWKPIPVVDRNRAIDTALMQLDCS